MQLQLLGPDYLILPVQNQRFSFYTVVWMNCIVLIDMLENMVVSTAEQMLQTSSCIYPENLMSVGRYLL